MGRVVVVNFGHPLSDDAKSSLADLVGSLDLVVYETTVHAPGGDLRAAATAAVEATPLDAREWQAEPIVVVLPSLPTLAAVLLAEMHGRMGHFPSVAQVVARTDGPVTFYEVAQVVNLDAVRAEARASRQGGSA